VGTALCRHLHKAGITENCDLVGGLFVLNRRSERNVICLVEKVLQNMCFHFIPILA
jgi:hypothetical protein